MTRRAADSPTIARRPAAGTVLRPAALPGGMAYTPEQLTRLIASAVEMRSAESTGHSSTLWSLPRATLYDLAYHAVGCNLSVVDACAAAGVTIAAPNAAARVATKADRGKQRRALARKRVAGEISSGRTPAFPHRTIARWIDGVRETARDAVAEALKQQAVKTLALPEPADDGAAAASVTRLLAEFVQRKMSAEEFDGADHTEQHAVLRAAVTVIESNRLSHEAALKQAQTDKVRASMIDLTEKINGDSRPAIPREELKAMVNKALFGEGGETS